MEPIFRKKFTIDDSGVDCFGRLKPSMLLFYCQEVATRHCGELSMDWNTMAARGQFWAVIRQKVQITRLPRSGEEITLETWPMPTTRTCYPRSTVAYDAGGNEIFRAITLWVIMDLNTRAMILPKHSGVEVKGTLTGSELAAPGSIHLMELANRETRRVRFSDLDRNGHMNNTRYLDWVNDLLPSAFLREHHVREFTICYHSESREAQTMDLHWELGGEGILRVDAFRENPEHPDTTVRAFSAQVVL